MCSSCSNFYKYSLDPVQNPLCVRTPIRIWVQLDDNEVEECLELPLATVRDLFPLLVNQPIKVMLHGKKVSPEQQLWKYEQTGENNPVIIKSCVAVLVKCRAKQSTLKRYSLDATVEEITGQNYFAHLGGVVLTDDTELSSLTTEQRNPIVLEKRELCFVRGHMEETVLIDSNVAIAKFVNDYYNLSDFTVLSNQKFGRKTKTQPCKNIIIIVS